MKLITLRCTYIAKSHSNFLSLIYEKKLAAVKGENSRLSLKHGFGGCDGLADLADSMDSVDFADSTDLADLADLADSYFNQHLDRLVYFA